jgi:hypothetical protein
MDDGGKNQVLTDPLSFNPNTHGLWTAGPQFMFVSFEVLPTEVA